MRYSYIKPNATISSAHAHHVIANMNGDQHAYDISSNHATANPTTAEYTKHTSLANIGGNGSIIVDVWYLYGWYSYLMVRIVALITPYECVCDWYLSGVETAAVVGSSESKLCFVFYPGAETILLFGCHSFFVIGRLITPIVGDCWQYRRRQQQRECRRGATTAIQAAGFEYDETFDGLFAV